MPFAETWMHLEIIILSEVSQAEKDKYDIAYMQNFKNDLIYKTETDSQTQTMNLHLPGEKAWWGIDWEFGIDMCTMLYLKYIANKDLLYSTGTLLNTL